MALSRSPGLLSFPILSYSVTTTPLLSNLQFIHFSRIYPTPSLDSIWSFLAHNNLSFFENLMHILLGCFLLINHRGKKPYLKLSQGQKESVFALIVAMVSGKARARNSLVLSLFLSSSSSVKDLFLGGCT